MEEKQSRNFTYIMLIVSAAISLIAVFNKELPPELLYIGIILLSIPIGFLFFSWIIPILGSFLQQIKRFKIVLSLYPQLMKLAMKFEKQINPSLNNNMHSIIAKIRNERSECKNILIRPIVDLHTTFSLFGEALEGQKITEKNFIIFTRTFFEYLKIYNREYVCIPGDTVITTLQENVISGYTREYEKYRTEYTTFLQECQDFADKVNSKLGTHLVTSLDFPRHL